MKKSTRALKAVTLKEGRVMSIRSQKFVEDENQDLCDYCAFSQPFEKFEECWVDRSSRDSLQKSGISQIITHCSMHQPIIAFNKSALNGLKGDFNTFRPGVAWERRLKEKQVIGLLNSSTGKLICKVSVIAIECGDLDDMIEKHAKTNHLILDDPSKDLRKLMTRMYGPQIINNDAKITVISMRRM